MCVGERRERIKRESENKEIKRIKEKEEKRHRKEGDKDRRRGIERETDLLSVVGMLDCYTPLVYDKHFQCRCCHGLLDVSTR